MEDIEQQEQTEQSAFVDRPEDYHRPTKTVTGSKKEIGVDKDDTLLKNIIDAVETSSIDMSTINEFTSVSQRRNEIYDLIDAMANDALMSSALETYAEDATEYNDRGRIVWAESQDSEIVKFITFLLDTMNVDKYIYSWAYELCMYGDVYLRLVRESEFEDLLFHDGEDRKRLDEEIKIKAYSKRDHYSHYVEMQRNPANMFELTKFGKTMGFIKTQSMPSTVQDTNRLNAFMQTYQFNKNDVEIYPPTEFVHACLEDRTSRNEEEVELFIDRDNTGKEDTKLTYSVKRGQPLFYNVFKIWRELTLLENSVLLNRVTKSAILRIIQPEVGDMPKEDVLITVGKLKEKIEQKTALNKNVSMSEYTNPGPVDNVLYIPTINGRGAITTSEIGGDPNVKSLLDLDYFKNRLWSAIRIPKQFMGDTDDAAGFSGGESLARISSRYAKAIKKIQNVLCQMITDAINLMLIDKGLDSYINGFSIKMQPPTTVEESERRDAFQANIQTTRDVMDLVDPIEDPVAKLKILQSLLSTYLSNEEVSQIIGDAIDKMEKEQKEGTAETQEEPVVGEGGDSAGGGFDDFFRGGSDETEPTGEEEVSTEETPTEEPAEEAGGTEESPEETPTDNTLPNPSDLGIDFTDNEA